MQKDRECLCIERKRDRECVCVEKKRDRDGVFVSVQKERERSRLVKVKNIKKQNLLYGCFKNNPHKR